MKNLYLILITCFAISIVAPLNRVAAQCPGGYTQAQVNWDNLDYYFNSVGSRPYSNYVSNAMEQTQKFAIGPNYVTIATSSSAVVNPGNFNGVTGENVIHTGELAGYTGADVQYNPNANGQTITLTFNTPVTNLNFALYDVDRGARIDFAAVNGIVPQLINVGLQGVTNLTAFLNNTIAPFITANAVNAANNVNTNTATVTVATPVTQITITITTVGTDAVFWLSDINACVTGSFPSNYNQTSENQPMTGPVINQPDYFIVTPDSDSAFMVDPITGKAWFLFSDPSNTYMNSFGYDPYNRIMYYISEGTSLNPNNKALKKYDFNTETISTVVADITTLNIPSFNSGVESAAAAFYNGQLFFGFEGGRYNSSNTRESIVYRIDFNGGGVPVNACQVFATNSYSGSSAIHDWADIVIENGILYNYNSRPGTTMVSYEHYDMLTGQSVQYLNPLSGIGNAFQAGLTWTGEQYSFASNNNSRYFENGTVGAPITITSAEGLTWQTGAGDASENFRPKCDFGDAPATYDPVAISPAVHERTDSIRLGPTWDREWIKRGVTSNEDVDDGLAYAQILSPTGGAYAVRCTTYNNSGANATLIAWLDYNGNGVFDASEACTPITVPSSASSQTFWLYWATTPNSFVNGDSTYLRVRITSQSAGMTSAHSTGYFANGEVEDYKVIVDNFPLSTKLISFAASLQKDKVNLDWSATEEPESFMYEVERSSNNIIWERIASIDANRANGTFNYNVVDGFPLKGKSYYRIKIIESTGKTHYSEIKNITYNKLGVILKLFPNPAKSQTSIYIETNKNDKAVITILNMQGRIVLSKEENLNKGANSISLPLPVSLVNGLYMICIAIEDEIHYQKLIINK